MESLPFTLMGHFRVIYCLCVKTSKNESAFPGRMLYFYMKDFAPSIETEAQSVWNRKCFDHTFRFIELVINQYFLKMICAANT